MTLSSCYFCGTAIEEPLSEYPVVPDALAPAPDEQVTVVLCPSCHRKLSTVLDQVVEAADQRQRTLGDTPPSAGDGDAGSGEEPAIDEDTAADLLGSDDPLAGGADGDSSEAEAGDDAAGFGSDGERNGAGGDDPRAADRSAGAERGETDDATTPGRSGTDTEDPDGITVDDPDRSSDTGGTGSDGRASPADASDAPSQATYNRVVRLLQNREFPVERDEIATVAMNAYDIPPEDFDAVIQTAVNRGVLEEDGPYLKQA